MDLMIRNYLDRAENELVLAASIKRLSDESEAKEYFKIDQKFTFYSSVISHAYYSIFYAAKAILLTKGISVSFPEEHRKTFDAFKEQFVDTGILDVKLLEIYKSLVIRADELLGIFKEEKRKRGNFTYKTIPQANQEPAEDSVKNAKIFLSNIKKVVEMTK